ncbi:MAG: beta-ketoacyl-[acyl-carrier-protein] synthase family protein [bacterium]|nr:beta-ketoacyl-[acyl-carrier-protein] synthase family protein [bacterium]
MTQRHHGENDRDVVVTGLGVISPYGLGCQRYWQGLAAGQCTIQAINLFPTDGFRSQIGSEIKANDVQALGTAHRSRANRFVLAAGEEAVSDAALHADDLATAAISIGGAGGGMLEVERWHERHDRQQDTRRQRPALRSMLPTAQTATLAHHFHIGGPQETPILACGSSAAAIVTIVDLIHTGMVEIGLAGGVDTLTRLCFMGFNALRLLDPQPCRPFARDRRGMSLGEGAAVLVLESRRHAVKRGAAIRADLVGCSITSDAFHPTAPPTDGEGAVRAIREAMARAHVAPDDIVYVNAHGTGTLQNDRAEVAALRQVFETNQVLVSSTKSLIGHTMGAAGAMEATATILAMQASLLPPTANLQKPDPDIPFDCLPHTARCCTVDYAMSNSFGFGGQNVSLIFRCSNDR